MITNSVEREAKRVLTHRPSLPKDIPLLPLRIMAHNIYVFCIIYFQFGGRGGEQQVFPSMDD